MREILSDILILSGLVVISVGLFSIAFWLGEIFAGITLIILGIVAAKRQ